MRYDDRDDDAPLDVWSFRKLERLQVHIDRTEADLGSRVVTHAQPLFLNLLVVREARAA